MLNNFKNCPVCQMKVILVSTRRFICANNIYHFDLSLDRWEYLRFPDFVLWFYPCSVRIELCPGGVLSPIMTATINGNLSFNDLDSYEKCLTFVQNYNLLK